MKQRRLYKNIRSALVENTQDSTDDDALPFMEDFCSAMARHKDELYFSFFQKIHDGFKRYADRMMVGGCGIRVFFDDVFQSASTFLSSWKKQTVLPDFVSGIYYDYNRGRIREDSYSIRNADAGRMKNRLMEMKSLMKNLGLQHIPFYLTEWN